jgi:hypothetical protein
VNDAEHARVLVEVGRAYYLDNLSKVDIARRYGISRFQVARLLTEARDSGVVRIEISPPAHLDTGRTRRLAERLGAREVVVAGSGSDPISTRETLARSLAAVIAAHAREGATVGVSWSRTIELAVRHLEPLPPCDVVQLVGALPVNGAGDSLDIVQAFRRMRGVRTWPVWSPLLVADPGTAARRPALVTLLEKRNQRAISAKPFLHLLHQGHPETPALGHRFTGKFRTVVLVTELAFTDRSGRAGLFAPVPRGPNGKLLYAEIRSLLAQRLDY